VDRMTKWVAQLLRIARITYVVAATACIMVSLLGLVAALYFQFVMTKGPSLVSVPPISQPTLPNISTDAIDNRLKPPTNLRVTITRASINTPLVQGDILGNFRADTFNGLAHFPEDVEILGGKDSDLFDRKDNGTQGTVLIPTVKFIEQVNSALREGLPQQNYDFALVAVARDTYGVPSQVTDLKFSLAYGRPVTAPTIAATSRQADTPTASRKMSDLARIAQDIALIAGSEGSTIYQSTYDRALREPDNCGTSEGNLDFVANYRRLFDHARPKLTATNLPAFYDGVCDSWRRAISEQASARANAEAAQYAAMNANRSAEFRYQTEAAAAWVARNITLIVVGSAFGTFLTICFLLAFLAMENHSNAMRNALVSLSESRRADQ